MAKRKRKKNHWTTKNTHIRRMKKNNRNKTEQFPLILSIIIVLSIIGMFITWALNTDRRGYDHYIGIPDAWIEWVK